MVNPGAGYSGTGGSDIKAFLHLLGKWERRQTAALPPPRAAAGATGGMELMPAALHDPKKLSRCLGKLLGLDLLV